MTGPHLLPPQWLAHRYDPEQDAFHFLNVPRERRASVPFLTDENLTELGEPLVARRTDVTGTTNPRITYVFHSAYCCSTLVSNCYDRPGIAHSLKEPVVLNDIVGWRLRGADPRKVTSVLADSLVQLARPFLPNETTVIKPSNVANGLAQNMLELQDDARALLLYAPLHVYLGSIAAKGLWGRLWVRDLLAKQLAEGLVRLDYSEQDFFLQSDLQVAAIGWLTQQALFSQLSKNYPRRVRTLDSEQLVAAPQRAIAALDALFDIVDVDQDRQVTVSAAFARNAKSGQRFAPGERQSNQLEANSAHREEIATVSAWAVEVAARNDIALTLPNSLI